MRGTGAGKKKQSDAIDEVEELLKLTQDDLLLKLTVNSHVKSKFDFVPETSHTNAIEPDLERRFQALRSKTDSKSKISAVDEDVDVDNLFARFAALKAPNATTASNSSIEPNIDESCGIADVEDEEDEVQRIINWAKDAARLDPCPSSDIDDADEDDDCEDDDDSDVDEATDTAYRKKKGSEVNSGNVNHHSP